MSDNEKDKNGLKPTQKKIISDAWYNFLMNTNLLDKLENKPRGWSWFWGLYRLYNYPGMLNQPADFNLKAIRDELPAEHWLKDVDDSELNAILNKNDDLMIPYVQNLVDVFRSGMGITSTIYFYDLSFDEISDFSNLIFPLNVIFEKITFIDDISFNNSIFLGSAYFIKADFPAEANFRNAVFHGETAKFSGAVFNKTADFTNATFKGYANFKGSKFGGRTSFQRAKFKFHAPRFYGAEFNNEMTFFGMVPPKFVSIFPPKLIRTSDEKLDKSPKNIATFRIDRKKKKKKYRQRIQENQNSYENTAILLEERKKYHDQHLFYRAEMRCRRRLERFFILRWSYIFYEYLANYGYGFGHALIWWLLNIGIGFYMLRRINHHAHSIVDSPIRCSILTSFANAHSFLFLHNGPLKGCYATFKALPEFSFVWGFQTIAGIPLLFLVMLTLRVRFRLK